MEVYPWEQDLKDGKKVITLTYAQSLDGCITRQPGIATTISSRESFLFTHQLRATHDALVVGVGTVNSDNPSLTTRLVNGASPRPVVIDSNLRISLESKLLTVNTIKPILICSEKRARNKDDKLLKLQSLGAEIWPCVEENGSKRLEMVDILKMLHCRFQSVMIEGGAQIITAIVGCEKCMSQISYVILTIAPIFIGGYNAIQKPLDGERKLRILDVKHEPDGDIIVTMIPK